MIGRDLQRTASFGNQYDGLDAEATTTIFLSHYFRQHSKAG